VSDITIEHLVAGYPNHRVLLDATLHVPSGSLTCVLGPSGCGKTTLLRVIAGFEPAEAGSIRLADRVVEDGRHRLAAERRNVGYVAQEGALFPHLTIADNIGFALSGRSRDAREARRVRVDELLELVDMTELAQRMPHQLSGGQQQRVAVARALARRPEVVLLDEPFASLDASLRARLRDDIRAVLRAAGVTSILVTHDRAEALSMSDQVAVMRDGRIVQAGSPLELYTCPVDDEVAAFVSDANLVPATVTNGIVTTAIGSAAAHPAASIVNGAAQAIIRPEQIRLVGGYGADPGDGRDQPNAAAIVTRVEYFGHDARVQLAVGHGDTALPVVARVPGSVPIAEGATVRIAIEAPIWVLAANA